MMTPEDKELRLQIIARLAFRRRMACRKKPTITVTVVRDDEDVNDDRDEEAIGHDSTLDDLPDSVA